ncbi:hypothetical protein J1N35_034169 [Gossypium stocksii]|uniref:Transposase MuDR plant domain-containing protein n=1 Tax=Gossypium stocksii TaxID=47602 RepID=A0A9D3UTF1_9ROSI|nr:hypothetical protein J1N35_034169 [Gossypium stocksii]
MYSLQPVLAKGHSTLDITRVDNKEKVKNEEGVENEEESETNDDSIRESVSNGSKIALFSKPEVAPIEWSGFDGGLGFLEIPYKRSCHPSSSTNFDDLQVGMEFSFKDVFVAIMKWHSIKHKVNFHVTKSRTKKYEVKCVIHNNRCPWKIMASVRKKTEF